MIPRPAWLSVLFACLFLAPAFGQRKEPAVGVAPAQPVQLTVKVRREGKTEIPLRVHGVANEPIKFLIRTAPVQGKLGEPRMTGRETAVAVYEPPADLAITTDRFFYAAQSTIGVSAAVEVSITILDQTPQLTIPDTIEFAPLRAGDTSSKLLEITNSGGGMASGEVIVEAPWRIEGKTGYRLGAGEIAIFKVIFAPGTGGTFEKVARFTSEPSRSTTLRGTAESSIAVNPTTLILQHQAGDPVRTGAFELVNQTDDARTLQLKSDPRLQLPPQVSLPARGRIDVPVQTAASDVRALEADILITTSDLELRLPVKAAAPGAIVRATQPAVAFGRLAVGPAVSAQFELENIGGAPGEVTWKIGPPFRTPQTTALLLPGEKRRFPIEIQSPKPGRFRAWLQCKAGAQTFDLPVEAETVAPRTAGSPGAMADAAPSPEPETTAPDPSSAPKPPPAVPADWLSGPELPAGVRILKTTPHTVTFEWPASLSPATQFQVEARIFSFDSDGQLQVTWHRIDGLVIKPQGASYVTTVSDLDAGQPWVLRVLPLKASGEPGERLFAISFSTPPKTSLLPTLSPLRVLVFVLLALVGWQVVARWRGANPAGRQRAR